MSSQAAAKKGKKKAKGTTISLTDFLQDAPPAPPAANIDWADESEDIDGSDLTYQSSFNNKQLLSSLPTGPRASRTIQVDLSKLPEDPPFTAFVGNLPYEADEDMLIEFFKDLKIKGVRLPVENGRFKGYGYVEFDCRQSLADALQHNDETFQKRQIRVDVAGNKNQDSRSGNRSYGGQSFGGGGFDGPDVTEGEWRRKPNDEFQTPQSNQGGYTESDYRYGDQRQRQYDGGRDKYSRYGNWDYGRHGYEDRRYDSRGYNRSDSYGDRDRDRGYGGDRDRGYGGDRDRGYGGDRDRGYGGDRDRGYGGDRDRGYGGDRDRGYGGDRDRGYGGDRDRGYGGDRDRGYGGGRDSGFGGNRSYGGDRDRGYGGDRDGGYGGGRDGGYGGGRDGGYGGGRDRGYGGSRDYGGGGSRDGGYGGSSRGYGGDRDRNNDYGGEGQNQDFRRGPETNSYESRDSDRQVSSERSDGPPMRPTLKLQPRTKPVEPSTASTGRSSIFGGAKPVDTAAREKEIEEKLKHEQAESVFLVKNEREQKRAPRRSSERSEDGHPPSPRRISRRTSSEKDYHDPNSRRKSTSPGRHEESKQDKDYRPAPAPKQNPWGRSQAGPPPEPEQHRSGGPKTSQGSPGSEEKSEPAKKPIVRPAPPPATNPWNRGPPKIDTRGVREEAEGDAHEDELNERTPEGADDMSRRSDGSGGDGSERGKPDIGRPAGQDRRDHQKPRIYGDGQKDDTKGYGPPHRDYHANHSNYQNEGRRRGDGGSGKRRDNAWDRGTGGYDAGRNSRRSQEGDAWRDGRRGEHEQNDNARNEQKKGKPGQEKRRDSSRDSRPECDRSAGAGQEQDKSIHPSRTKKGRAPPELDPEPVIEFVQQSKFSALEIEDDDDDDVDESRGQEDATVATGAAE